MSPPRSSRLRSLRSRSLIALGLAVVVGLIAFGGLQRSVFIGYRLQVSDALFPTGAADKRVKVVAIDRDSIGRVGLPWPWPRRLHAQISRELSKLGAKAIVFDVVFDPPTSEDDVLARAAKSSGTTVMATLAEFEGRRDRRLYAITALTIPAEPIAKASAALGHSSVTPDPADGVVRSLPLVLETPEGDIHPSLSLAAFMQADSIDDVYTLRPNGIQVGGRFIPTGRLAVLDISFAPELRVGAPEAPIVSAVDVLNGKVERDDIQGSIVLIGVTDPSLGDDRATPVAKADEMPGVLIHANALNTMLTGGYLHPASDGRTALTAGIMALVVGLMTLLGPVWLAPLGLVAVFVGHGLWTFIQFDAGRVNDLLYPMLAAVLAFVASLAIRYFTELRGRRRASALFSQYVPKPVAYQLLDAGRVDDAVRGERVELTVLFCDLRGFTAQSGRMEPVEVRDMLNVYYDETSKLVHRHGGTLLNFVGDEVFAVWGAPMPDPDNANHAVACAREFQDASSEINRRLSEAGLPPVAYGIGLHTGEVVAAHVGTEMRRQYTVLGDTVNCGSRLCTIAGRNEIVVSEETYRQLDPRPPAEVLPGVKLKGVGRELLPHRLWPEELKDPTGQVRGKVED